MKKNILFVLALAAFGANAQQKLVGLMMRQFDQSANATSIDSIEYIYNSWDGSLTSNEPKFKFYSTIFDHLYSLPTIKCNVENRYILSFLILSASQQNTIINGNITDSEIAQSDRQEYTYDPLGNLTNIDYYLWNGSQFEIDARNTYEYDASSNLLVESYISDPIANPIIETVDSMFYDASNNMTRAIAYELDGSSLSVETESIMTYTGNEISNLRLYDVSTFQLAWAYDIYYTYSGGLPTSLEAYTVNGGVPETTASREIHYTYNSDNQLLLYEGYILGDLWAKMAYTYDTEGFVKQIESSNFNFSTSGLYVSRVRDFYYQSTADLNELSTVDAIVYPNPTNDFITVYSDAQIDRVTVLATDGKVMIEQKGSTVDVSGLTAGIYLVNALTSEGVGQTRFMKN